MLPSHYHNHFIKFYVQQQWCKVCVQESLCEKHNNEKEPWIPSIGFLSNFVVYNSSALLGFKIWFYASKTTYMSNQTSHHFRIMMPLWYFTFGTSLMVVGKWPTCHSMDELPTIIMPLRINLPLQKWAKMMGVQKTLKTNYCFWFAGQSIFVDYMLMIGRPPLSTPSWLLTTWTSLWKRIAPSNGASSLPMPHVFPWFF
jgi:hypothetical protein